MAMTFSSVRKSAYLALAGILLALQGATPARPDIPSKQRITKPAAESCSLKWKKVQEAEETPSSAGMKTSFSESEINSYLALDLSSSYHPSLKSLVFTFREGKLQAVATIDFDRLAMNSSKVSTKLLAAMLSGVHHLQIQGKLIAAGGKAQFQLEEARFDNGALPNFLVEEIITSVGRKQKPPFDPLQPNDLPYGIEKVALHPGNMIVYQ
jgi:hypothetical protein